MNGILQGTTPTLTIKIPAEIPVSEIRAIELAFKHGGTVTLRHREELIIDTETNTISRSFSEEETLALNPAQPIFWQLRIETPGGIYGTPGARINVLDLYSDEVLT